ncbi:hypothetical protein Amet_0128 [Alkaliphilus metalliredigens QYMF]|uniref:Lipoprotein n=1 Tax=Alkaliphilus metalliredigens (strain QYMF) TaxID=293826 RepID=A6TJJ9_ALKMQ|nr:hypothetical protein [Alkaliphilus metalliredigens]ABR46367.1 hypothetical protein Amet_0128 [Alkaliphilus metalliredigens QYMF]
MYKRIILIIAALFIFAACGEKLQYSVPSLEQVNEFISDNSVNALAIKEAEDFTIVLYENENGFGHYVLHRDQNNKLYDGKVIAMRHKDYQQNTLSLGGVASGKNPFVTVIINDDNVLDKATELEILFTDGVKVKEPIDNKGIIIIHTNNESDKIINYLKVTIYDSDMNILYEK